MQAKLSAEFIAAFCPLCTIQITHMHQQGLGRRLGRIGQMEAFWACSMLSVTVLKLVHGVQGAAWFGCVESLGGF